MSTEIISDAEIAGFMGWRGPGAYTQQNMKRIKLIIEEVVRRVREATVKDSLTTDMGERIADILVGDHIALMNENAELRKTLAKYPKYDPPEQVIVEAWHGQSNINSRFNACQHKEYCVQLKQHIENASGEPK